MFGLALTVQGRDPYVDRVLSRDLILRMTESQTVGDIIVKLATFIGLPLADAESRPIPYSVLVKRTRSALDPKAPLAMCDVREGDTLTLMTSVRGRNPNAVSARPRPATDRAP